MGVLPALIWTGLHLSCAAIDMALVLLLFRIIGQGGRIGWIATVNDAAKPVVDPLNAVINLRWQAITSKRLSKRGALLLSMGTLCLARFSLDVLAGLLK